MSSNSKKRASACSVKNFLFCYPEKYQKLF